MPTLEKPLTMFRGGKKTWVFSVSASDGAVDLSSASAVFTVRLDYPSGSISGDSDAAVVFSRRTGGSGVTTTASGKIYVSIPAESTFGASAFEEPVAFRYGLKYALPSDDEPVIAAQGPFYLRPDVVRGL
jgi:hypothetical protein